MDPARQAPSSDASEYLVVARRYRPQTFDELIGQQHVASALRGAIQSGRVGHGYLFTGARGVGKTSAARILAKCLNCSAGPTPEPCGTCDLCLSIASGDDIDVLEIDGASNRGIDEIRQLRQNVGMRPSRGRFKIYIIDEVHMLTKEAFNALLKTLEEPPEHVKFIFATTEPNKIPITILSRCQRFDFLGIDTPAIAARLQTVAASEGVELTPAATDLIARRAAGSLRDSQSLLEQLLSSAASPIDVEQVHALLGTAPATRLQEIADALIAGNAALALTSLDAAIEGGAEVAQLVDQLLGHFRDLMAVAAGCPAELMMQAPQDAFEQMQQAADQLGLETILAMVQILQRGTSQLRQSMHPRTVAEMVLVRLAQLEHLAALPEVIEQLRREGSQPPAKKKGDTRTAARDRITEPTRPAPTAAPPRSQHAGQPLDEVSGELIWHEALASLNDLVADQAAMSDSIAILAPNRLVVKFPGKYTSCKEFCERPEQKSKLVTALETVAGQSVQLDFELQGVADSVAPPAQPRTRRAQLAEVVQRPIVQRALELFDVEQPRIESANETSHENRQEK